MNTNSRNVTYSTVGDYQLPNLTLNQPRKPLGKYGRLRRTYLMNHRPVLYNTMLLNGSLYPHLMIESKALQKRVRAVYRRLGLPTRTTYDKEKVLAEMLHDKKAQSGQITIIKVPGLGCWRAETIPVEGLRPLLGIEE